MKKGISIALVAIMIMGGTIAFADTPDQEKDDSRALRFGGGRGPGMMHEAFQEDFWGILGMTADELREQIKEGKTLAEIAEEEGVLDELKDALYDAQKERTDTLVDEGKLTEEQAEEMLEKCQTMLDEGKFGMAGAGRPYGQSGPGINEERQEVILDILGMTADELKEQMKEGKTLAEIAEEEGVSDELKDALYDAQKERTDTLVDEGKLTEEQAEEMLEKCQTMLDEGRFMIRPGIKINNGRMFRHSFNLQTSDE